MLLIKTLRDNILTPLQSVCGIVEKRHTLPILSNVLIEKSGDQLTLLATDIEIQVKTHTPSTGGQERAAFGGGSDPSVSPVPLWNRRDACRRNVVRISILLAFSPLGTRHHRDAPRHRCAQTAIGTSQLPGPNLTSATLSSRTL